MEKLAVKGVPQKQRHSHRLRSSCNKLTSPKQKKHQLIHHKQRKKKNTSVSGTATASISATYQELVITTNNNNVETMYTASMMEEKVSLDRKPQTPSTHRGSGGQIHDSTT